MNCLICGDAFQPVPTWGKLFLYEKESSTCNRCFSKFTKSDTTIDFSDFQGTHYEGAVDAVTALYSYNEAMKSYLHQYKFLQDVALAQVFAKTLHETFEGKEGIVVPIPMHPEKLVQRTFAQVDELLNSAGIPFQHLLTKTATSEQGKKTRKERLEASPLFEVRASVEAKNYILYDDIYTTGATIHHAAKLLKDVGATRVEAITLIKG
ncbi:ComF family protein [Psychrobacillus lasiicapitis]|uniref:ComF family protein n=1 Tax=Psychrobacillus lasiicapitis TaxID=1636719 RepID=A0A544TE22_9BACI|nr:ComF family protein [Psychrobacillus lasiicapitis]TQR15711.1 ComF family protein [Psychrobacillus lasiicapitis]GGA18610.1 amidophosphoribosyltransferase [Psychrobacillus lasiicapitis]